ncbi:MAG: amidohydrolase family protein [Chloroflexi bacterium]|jgi:L-fuconolactonase|nr:amidohydrolase family protein [Chloroflexota bacterium]MBT5319422.1 amidohydrolase family protein [Chloroflexota bacterium]MBT6680833.1 amidohydrolase family protein [Chloroflexota bacterium]
MPSVVDSHHHFWDLSELDYPWMPPGDNVLRQNRLPSDLAPLLKEVGVEKTVIVQAHSSIEEARWLLRLAHENDFVAGVVAWVDLADPDVGNTLDQLQQDPYFKGVRHIWHDEPDDAWIMQRAIINGLKELAKRDIPFDLLPRPQHLPYIPRVLDAVPDLRTVVDHIAKPLIADRVFEPWLSDLKRVAEIPGVYCKISGMVTEADTDNWKPDDLTPYVENVVDMFGYQRLMFGSDWPVCTLAGSYKQVFHAASRALGKMSVADRSAVFGGNAERFYGL